jgi:predicted secreted hydrolase
VRPPRRLLLGSLFAGPLWCSAAAASTAPRVERRALVFPRDHGAHTEFRTEWWYATGWLAAFESGPPAFGFQVTFFRTRTGLAADNTSRFAARQLLFAHAAVSDLATRQLHHAERIARWSGDANAPRAAAALDTTRVHIEHWRFEREADGRYRTALQDDGAGFGYRLQLAPTQPLLLQGDAGFSRKGPREDHASHYYSQPQLAVSGTLRLGGRQTPVQGRAWLDHEWSQTLMPEGAVGWDWIGMNLADGSALTAFRLRRADGTAVWAGGSFRAAGDAARIFSANEVRFTPLAWWTSPATRGRYPTRWRVATPAGEFEVRALFDAQELNSRASTGTVYWEGLSGLLRDGREVGRGYLEMTGYAGALRL